MHITHSQSSSSIALCLTKRIIRCLLFSTITLSPYSRSTKQAIHQWLRMRCRAISCSSHRTICLLRECHHRERNHLTLSNSLSRVIAISSIFSRSSLWQCRSTPKGRFKCPTISLRLPNGLKTHPLALVSHAI